jgi:hypothetical protein
MLPNNDQTAVKRGNKGKTQFVIASTIKLISED